MPDAKLPAEDAAKVEALGATARKLAAAGELEAARDFEEQAMLLLGYHKGWSRCGAGSFIWMRLPRPNAGV